TLHPTPFLDISSKISSYTNSEEGFLGIVFSPNYKTDRKFYVDYTANISGQLTSVIEEYKADPSDSSKALITPLTILTQSQPYANHNGGNLMFGKDGYLYINVGDGGSGGDPQGNGQNKNTFLGKILRIDVSNSSMSRPYVIPSSNPFYNDPTPGIKKEIWAYGVRNPWRSSVDRLTGDLWIGDVGQGAVEEIDYQPVNTAGGRNYGWNIMEGTACYNSSTGCTQAGLTLPIYDYTHAVGKSITGGYIYRSAQSKSLFGTYIFADYVQKWIDGIRESNGTLSGSVTHYITNAQATGNPVSFGEDRYGDQYILFNSNGTVYKLEDTSYLRKPKAYFTIAPGNGSFSFKGIEGRNLTYQWLKNDIIIPGATSPDYTTSASGTYTLAVTNILNISDTSAPFTFGTLPLSITSFNAQKITGHRIQLQWSIASEQNISGYSIMRKLNNEANFSSVGFVESKSLNGTSNDQQDYTFTDSAALNNSKIFYRLQIQNMDGSYTYSDIRSITFNGIKSSFSFYPNPAKGIVQINIEDFDKPLIMVMYDNMGKQIIEQYLNQQNTKIGLSGLHGIYIVQLSDKDGSNVTRNKLVVE
ncbi:MAG TPA: PQQ-dependent sugar dehydrogenase, partial [Chitinophagaceae bacterium]|nr:PQQ-dependent sugar dehydrogenase [Chitinophagaceae bacterium]